MSPEEEMIFRKLNSDLVKYPAHMLEVPRSIDFNLKEDIMLINMRDCVMESVYADSNVYRYHTIAYKPFDIWATELIVGLLTRRVITMKNLTSYQSVEDATLNVYIQRKRLISCGSDIKATWHNEYTN